MFATFRYSMAGNSARFFFILSGEHPTLPLAELKAILHAYAVEHKIVGSFYKLIEIEADRAKLESIASRGAYVDEMGEEVLHTEDNLESIKREERSCQDSSKRLLWRSKIDLCACLLRE